MTTLKTDNKIENVTAKSCRTTYVACWLMLFVFLFSVTARGGGDLTFFMMSISLLLFPLGLSLHLLSLLGLIALRTNCLSTKEKIYLILGDLFFLTLIYIVYNYPILPDWGNVDAKTFF